jgi:hypothetical protein
MPELSTEIATRTVLGGGVVKIAGGGHVALITRLASGCLLVTESGTQTAETRRAMIREIEAEIAATSPVPVTVFVDVRAGTRMDAAGRDEWSNFGKRREGPIDRVVVLVRSKLLEMAFSLISMFVGGGVIRVVAGEDALLAEIRRRVPTFRALPTAN